MCSGGIVFLPSGLLFSLSERVCFLGLLQYRHRIMAASLWSRSFGRDLVRRGVHLLLRLGTLFRNDDDGRLRLHLRDLPLLYNRSPLLRLSLVLIELFLSEPSI